MKTAAILLVLSLVLFAGCKAKTVDRITDILVNMTEIEQNNTINVTLPEINETIPVVNNTLINETSVFNTTNTTIINEPIVLDDEESEYSEYRDTGMIDDSIDDIELLSE